MKCETCKFWDLKLNLAKGENPQPWIGACRRYPPTQKKDGEIRERDGQEYMQSSQFEIFTPYYEFCGEYVEKPEHAE
jgi:hypothetical protein